MKRTSLRSFFSATALLLAFQAPGKAAISFLFSYQDASWSADAKTSLNNAATLLASYFPSYTTQITMNVTGSNANTTTLASAGSNYSNVSTGFGNLGIVGTKIQTGVDGNGAGADGLVDANFFHNWSFGSTVSGSQFDFTDTMVHELAHAMGFISLVESNGLSSFNNNAAGAFSPFDRYLANGSNESLVNPSNFTTDGKWTAASVGGTGTVPATANTGLYFNGPNARAANGGNLVPLFSPSTWSNGSSGSHVDDDFYTGVSRKTMNAATLPGVGARQFSPIEQGIFRDLGYAVVPEPGSAALALGAFALLATRRRRA